MRRAEVEFKVLQVIDRLEAGSGVEDDALIELKSEWPSEPRKTARQLAAHANAARGAEILWIIGVDEKRGVLGAGDEELANWWPQVQTHFDGDPPLLTSYRVHPDASPSIVALVFQTDGAPYVFKTGTDPVTREVPWREGTRARSATRNDLLRVLVPQTRLPLVQPMEAQLHVSAVEHDYGEFRAWRLEGVVYIERVRQPMFFPWHRLEARVTLPGVNYSLQLADIRLYPHDPGAVMRAAFQRLGEQPAVPQRTMTISSSVDQLIVEGPGLAGFSASIEVPVEQGPAVEVGADDPATYSLRLVPADSDLAIEVSATLDPSERLGDALCSWKQK